MPPLLWLVLVNEVICLYPECVCCQKMPDGISSRAKLCVLFYDPLMFKYKIGSQTVPLVS